MRVKTRKEPEHQTSFYAFTLKNIEIDKMLSRLQQLSSDHFNLRPEEINWANVGDLNQYAHLLRQVTDAAFQEGEHAC